MENKYYTPTIEEFHVGFGYEYISNNICGYHSKFDSSNWTKYEFKAGSTEDEPSEIDCIEYAIKKENCDIRVKYLDKEDVESLGWKFDGKSTYKLNCYSLSGQLEYQNIEIEQNHEDVCMGEWKYYDELVFRGKIKNKSELNRIMNQLNIKTT